MVIFTQPLFFWFESQDRPNVMESLRGEVIQKGGFPKAP